MFFNTKRVKRLPENQTVPLNYKRWHLNVADEFQYRFVRDCVIFHKLYKTYFGHPKKQRLFVSTVLRKIK